MSKLFLLFSCCLLLFIKVFSQGDQNVNPFLGQTNKKALLKAEPDAASKTLLLLPIASQIYSLTDEDNNGFLKVIYIKTNRIGWLQKSSIKKIKNIPLSQGNSFVESGTSESSDPEVEITNKTSLKIALTVGDSTFYLNPHSKRSVSINSGFQYYTASAPTVIPLSGSHNFNLGSRYTWEFYIVTR